jgi:methyl acetate hydrolase
MGHALYSTALDYMRFLRMYLNKGQLDGKRLLSEKGVETLLSNQIGDIKIGMLKTVVPALTADAEFFPGAKKPTAWHSCVSRKMFLECGQSARSSGLAF